MRNYSSIFAVLLLSLYSITFAHSVVAHQHGEGLAMESQEHSHTHHHSHDSGHIHSDHGHSHQDEQSAKHTLWGFLDHIFAAHSSTSAEVQSTYYSVKGQDVLKRADFQNAVECKGFPLLIFSTSDECPESNIITYRHSYYSFLLHHSITLRGPPFLV
jgi:hypothetical protein